MNNPVAPEPNCCCLIDDSLSYSERHATHCPMYVTYEQYAGIVPKPAKPTTDWQALCIEALKHLDVMNMYADNMFALFMNTHTPEEGDEFRESFPYQPIRDSETFYDRASLSEPVKEEGK